MSVDITGVTASELSVNNVDYQVLNDSVITIPDADKYQDASESIYTDSSDSESDSTEINPQYVLFHSGYSYHSFNIEIFIFFVIFVCYINIGTIYVQPLALCPPLAYS